MQNEELFEVIDDKQGLTQHYLGLSFSRFFVLLLMIIVIGVYVGNILYGANSMEVLVGLQDYETYLKTQTHELKNQNAELQREYFEIKEISAQ